MADQWLVGVDVGGTTIKIAFISDSGEIHHKWEIPTDKRDQGNHIPSQIALAINEKLREIGETKNKLSAIGIGAPGPVNDADGSVEIAVNLGWSNFPLKERLVLETSLPVTVDNDANVAAIGEMWKGAGEGAKDLLLVTLGTGVGGGVIANGEIVHGVNGAGGELGHITTVPEGGFPCNCGKTGCLETMASATGVVRLAMKALESRDEPSLLRDIYGEEKKLTSKQIFEAAQENDRLALEVVQELAFHLGLALANSANVLNPQKIVIGGGVSKAGDTLLNPVRDEFQRFAFPRVSAGAEVMMARMGNDAGILGAAWLAKTQMKTIIQYI
ncbi:ROK family glucokinase [Ammoniphilus sp. YIM 78166]|uniref:ROK family glucokinase n=1 Tax=Ammoniphilus sp. YIM 78166 TaxID=1644106 RepID=UPI00106F5864|nr:ROK family glucokinase [Ammoniphilus sp. YIM 78166]